jgi:hypothetical protein
MPAGVFISYRREDAAPYARLLQYELRERFPEADVFVDMDSIEPGSDFAETIQRAVSSCAVLLALIGRQWLTLTDEEGQRRLEDPDDYVRLEIQTALTRGVRVIPVLVDNARALRHQQLPEPLAKLARLNAVELSYNRYQYDAERLLNAVGRMLTVTASTPEARLDEQQFLARLNDEGYRQALEALLEAARSVGMLMEWGSSGASIRLPTPDRSEPLTVAWVFPSDTGWAGLRHLTLGYDTGSAAAIPSVQAALTQFVQAVGSIPGATPAKAKALEAYTFNPVAVRAQQVDLAGVLRRLVQTVREGPAAALPLHVERFIESRVATPERRRLIQEFVARVLNLGNAEPELGASSKNSDGLGKYLMLRHRGVRRWGAAVYVTPHTGRVQFHLAARRAQGCTYAKGVDRRPPYQVVTYLTSPAAVEEAVELSKQALSETAP